jgi:hypothetical protein
VTLFGIHPTIPSPSHIHTVGIRGSAYLGRIDVSSGPEEYALHRPARRIAPLPESVLSALEPAGDPELLQACSHFETNLRPNRSNSRSDPRRKREVPKRGPEAGAFRRSPQSLISKASVDYLFCQDTAKRLGPRRRSYPESGSPRAIGIRICSAGDPGRAQIGGWGEGLCATGRSATPSETSPDFVGN